MTTGVGRPELNLERVSDLREAEYGPRCAVSIEGSLDQGAQVLVYLPLRAQRTRSWIRSARCPAS
jgi:hypothetical protein